MMRVFTTIFLAETLRANVECVEEAEEIDQNDPGVLEFKETLRGWISRLEGRNFPAFEDPDRK